MGFTKYARTAHAVRARCKVRKCRPFVRLLIYAPGVTWYGSGATDPSLGGPPAYACPSGGGYFGAANTEEQGQEQAAGAGAGVGAVARAEAEHG